MLIAGRSITSLLFNKVTLAVALFALAGWAMYLGITEIRDAGVAEGKATERAEGLSQAVQERDAAIDAWQARYDEIAAQAATDDAQLAEKMAELQELADEMARRQEDFNDAINTLEGMDGTCARRPVPAVVDSLLGSTGAAGTGEAAPDDR